MTNNQLNDKSTQHYEYALAAYHFLKMSAERFSSDLEKFKKESDKFSDEQLLGIVAYSDLIKKNIEALNRELASRF